MKLPLIAAALFANLWASASAQALDWNKDVAAQAAVPRPTIYAFPQGSDRFPYELSGLKSGVVRAELYALLDPWTNRVFASLQVCDSSAISDMEPSPRCAYLRFGFYKQLTVDLEKKTVSAGAELVAVLADDGSGPRLRWTAGHGIDYRIDTGGNVEVFLKRAP